MSTTLKVLRKEYGLTQEDLALKCGVGLNFVRQLEQGKPALFKCFGGASVAGACAQMLKAKQIGEPCPFSKASLNELFGSRQ